MMKHAAVFAVVLSLFATDAFARVKLITLPVRERVEVQLDHPNATLIEEERIVPLVKGVNQVDFSWAGTSIDPGTIVFRVFGPAEGGDGGTGDVNVLSVSYPPGENALVWQVAAQNSGSARVRISYLLGGLTKSFNYRAVASQDESTLTLSQYIRVQNFAGEAFDDTTIYAGYGDTFTKPVGLNETREILVEKIPGVPVAKTYTCDVAEFGFLNRGQQKLNVPMHYVIKNDAEQELGKAPLPMGKVRIFQKDSQGTTAFLGEDWGRFTPIDDEMRLYLGLAQDVAVKRWVADNDRTRIAGNLFNQRVVVKYEVENFKDQPVTLNVAEQVQQIANDAGVANGGRSLEWTIGQGTTLTQLVKDRTDQHRIEYRADLPARDGDKAEKVILELEIVFKNVWN